MKEKFELEVRVDSDEHPSENMVFWPTQGGPGVEIGQVVTATRRRTRRYQRWRSARPVVAGPSLGRRRVARPQIARRREREERESDGEKRERGYKIRLFGQITILPFAVFRP